MSQQNAVGWEELAVDAKFFCVFQKSPSFETVCSSRRIHRFVCLFEALLVIDTELQRAFELVPREMLTDGGFRSCSVAELTPDHLNTQRHAVTQRLNTDLLTGLGWDYRQFMMWNERKHLLVRPFGDASAFDGAKSNCFTFSKIKLSSITQKSTGVIVNILQ